MDDLDAQRTMSYSRACAIVDERSSRRCERCGKPVFAGGSHHHRKLRSRVGTDDPSNLVFLCGSGTTGCHGWVHARPADATEQGWMVGGSAIPEQIRVQSARFGDVFLGRDGQIYGVAPTECARATRAARLAATKWPRVTTHEGVSA